MRRFLIIIFLAIFIMSVASSSIAGAQENSTGNKTESSTATLVEAKSNETESPTPTLVETKEQEFRVGPTVRLRPLNSEISKSADGIIELFLNNPSLNDVTLEVDMTVSVPSGIYIYGDEGGMSGGAGTVTGHFSVPPGSSRTITLHIKGEEVGTFPVHFSGNYWPSENKDKWNPISLDNSFEVKEPSNNLKEPSSNPDDSVPTREIPYSYILTGLIVVIGIILIVRRPPKTEVTIEE